MSDNRFFSPGLPQFPTNTDPKVEPDLRDVYNAIRNVCYLVGQYGGFEPADTGRQNFGQAVYTAGVYKRRVYVQTLEAMTYGTLVHLTTSGGALVARIADATTNARPCYGICNTEGASGVGATIEVALPGCYVTSIGGMVQGDRYFLAANPAGLLSNVAPGVVGNIRQALGFALDATVFYFFPNIDWTVV